MKPAVTELPPPYSVTQQPGVPASAPSNPSYPQPGPVYTQPSASPYPPPPGYSPYGAPAGSAPPPPPGSNFVPNYGATNIILQPQIIAVGACPACRVGILEDDFTCLGILCAILFFPIGILCCLALKNRRCTNCGAYFA